MYLFYTLFRLTNEFEIEENDEFGEKKVKK